MTRQVFFKLRRILEPDMANIWFWGHEKSIKSVNFITTLTWTRWSKMAKIPKIYGTSEVKTILAKEAKLQNSVGQCCWAKTLN